MTNEEIQRTMEFILEQQAQFAASIQRAEEQRIRDTPRLTRLEESFQSIAELAQITEERFDRLGGSHQVLLHLVQNSDRRLENLEDLRIRDNERVNNLEERRSHDDKRVTRLEDAFQLLTQLAENADARLVRLERPGG